MNRESFIDGVMSVGHYNVTETSNNQEESQLVIYAVDPADSKPKRAAVISLEYRYTASTNFNTFKTLPEREKAELHDLITLFSDTPLGERENPDRYHYRLPGYVNPEHADGVYVIVSTKNPPALSVCTGDALDAYKAEPGYWRALHSTADIENYPLDFQKIFAGCEPVKRKD